MGMAAPTFHTADMVRALADETRHWPRYETVYGELLVTPAPRAWHQEVVGRLYVALSAYIEREPVGAHVFLSPSDVSWGPDTLVQPDLFVVPLADARPLDWARMRTLLLAVEVLSPSSLRADRFTKRRLYQERGVPLYWVIDAEAGAAELWTPGDHFPRVEREALVWAPAVAATAFSIGLEELLAPV
jgi:Uma2 family endonuclease